MAAATDNVGFVFFGEDIFFAIDLDSVDFQGVFESAGYALTPPDAIVGLGRSRPRSAPSCHPRLALTALYRRLGRKLGKVAGVITTNGSTG